MTKNIKKRKVIEMWIMVGNELDFNRKEYGGGRGRKSFFKSSMM